MTRTLLRLTAAAVLWQFAAAIADAQLVQVGPGYVKAPFVRVYGPRDRYDVGGTVAFNLLDPAGVPLSGAWVVACKLRSR